VALYQASFTSPNTNETPEKAMKEGIHPKYQETTVTCGCGNTFQTRSVRSELKIDICNECHPFYTGKLKYVDTAGRIDKFQKKFAAGTYGSLAPTKKKKGKKK
jgi:large subunit ribosomal protein L31